MKPLELKEVLAKRPLGLVFDIDGTLSPIAPTPQEAQLYPGIASLLIQARKHAHVAIMTGRDVNNGATMVDVEELTYIGSHGLEWSDGLPGSNLVTIMTEAIQYIEPGKRLLDLAEQILLPVLPGLLVERKRIGGAIHYRLCRDPKQAHQEILTLLTEQNKQSHMRIEEGKRVIEIRPPVAIDKGKALRKFVENFNLQGVIFAGDDRTDLDGILEIARLRQDGIAALSIGVKHKDALPALLENADIVVNEVEGMASMLQTIVTTL